MAITFACTCWAIWSLIVIIFDKIIPRRFENFLRIFIATVLLTSLVFLKVKAFLIVYRFNHTLVHDRNSLKVEGLTERDREEKCWLTQRSFQSHSCCCSFQQLLWLSLDRPVSMATSCFPGQWPQLFWIPWLIPWFTSGATAFWEERC